MDGTSATDRFCAWARDRELEVERFTSEQSTLIGAALNFLDLVGRHRLLVRFVVYFLTHSGVRLSAPCIGKVVGRSVRAVEAAKAASAAEVVEAAHRDDDRHGGPTLEPVHAGPIAEFIFEHRACTLEDISAFAGERLGVVVGIKGVRTFLQRHGLIELKKKEPVAPLF